MYQFDRKRFGRALKKFRNGKSYKIFAQETGIDALTLARFECGSRVSNANAFLRLCKLMGVSHTDFPKPRIKAPHFQHPLPREQWQALMRLYAFRHHEYTRESSVGNRKTVRNLARLGLLDDMLLNYRRMPYVRISEAGVKYFELNDVLYRLRYPDLYGYVEPISKTQTMLAVAVTPAAG